MRLLKHYPYYFWSEHSALYEIEKYFRYKIQILTSSISHIMYPYIFLYYEAFLR